MEISRLYVELQNAIAQAGKEVDLSSTVSLSTKITDLFIKDLHFCLSKNIEGWLWRIWKSLIDSSKSKENTVHIVISLLTQLSLGLHLEYKLFPHDLPPIFGISPAIAGTKQRDLEEKDRLKILGFIALRMGDLHRYKGELESAEKFYHIALVLQPFKGEIWNQLGLTAKLRGSFLNAVYYHIRALHSPVVFQGASTNVTSILKKYSEKEDVSQLAPRQELYLTVLAKIHFMLPISEELIDRLGSKLLDVRTIAPLLAIYSTLGENTNIEKVSKRVIEQLLKLTFLAIVERFEVLGRSTSLSDRMEPTSTTSNSRREKGRGSKKERRRSGAREASPAYCAGRAPPPLSKSGSIFQYLYRQMATLVASASGGGDSSQAVPPEIDDTSHSRQQSSSSDDGMQPEKLAPAEEVIDFLLDHVVSQEPILSSINFGNKNELRVMLADVVSECYSCSSSCCIKDETGSLLGICLASRPTLFEKQMDKLCSYDFKDEGMNIAVEFLKFLFNRVDFVYHCEENGISKPIFLMMIAVRPDCFRKGYGRKMLNYCIGAAVEDKSDGAVALCSGLIYHKLIGGRFKEFVHKIRYDSFRGYHKEPPIRPADKRNDSLNVLLTKLQ